LTAAEDVKLSSTGVDGWLGSEAFPDPPEFTEPERFRPTLNRFVVVCGGGLGAAWTGLARLGPGGAVGIASPTSTRNRSVSRLFPTSPPAISVLVK
jgi:hypothetical protein